MHYDFREFFRERKVDLVVVSLGFAFFMVGFVAGYLCGLRNVHDNGTGTATVGQQLNEAGTNISNAKDGIDAAQGHAGNVAAGIGTAQESTDYLTGTVNSSAELIGQCQQIVERIRQRGKKDTSAN